MLDLCYNTQNILRHSASRIEATQSRRPLSSHPPATQNSLTFANVLYP
jgi:hypothetical protein